MNGPTRACLLDGQAPAGRCLKTRYCFCQDEQIVSDKETALPQSSSSPSSRPAASITPNRPLPLGKSPRNLGPAAKKSCLPPPSPSFPPLANSSSQSPGMEIG